MDLNTLLERLGTPLTNPDTARSLNRAGVDDVGALGVSDGLYTEYFISKPRGFSLIFTDEAMFLGRSHQIVGTGPLYFTGVFLYAGGKDGYTRFAGELPLGIRFDATRQDLVAALGEPSWARQNPQGGPGIDVWRGLADHTVHIAYGPNATPAVITLSVPRVGE